MREKTSRAGSGWEGGRGVWQRFFLTHACLAQDQNRSPCYPLHPSLKVSSHKAGSSVSEGLLRSQSLQTRRTQPLKDLGEAGKDGHRKEGG